MKLNLIPPFILLIPLAFSFISCDSGYADNSRLSYEEAKYTIEQEEKMYPASFLHVDGTSRKNFIGEWVLEGKISNTATVAKYKDVILNVSYYSKTETHLGTEKQILYDFFNPGTKVKFKIKSFGYKGAKSIKVDIVDATAIN